MYLNYNTFFAPCQEYLQIITQKKKKLSSCPFKYYNLTLPTFKETTKSGGFI